MKKYENYKSTEIPWVSQVPSHWALIRNGNILILKHNVVGDRHTQFDLLSLTTGGIRIKNADDTRGKVPASFENYQEVLPGDMVFCLFDLDCSAVFSGKSEYHGMITSAYDVAMPNLKLVSSSYLDYWFCTVFSERYYKIYSKSVRYTISWEIFKALKTPIPSRDEQDQIVRYLDWQVSKINRLISAKRKQIQLLKERQKTRIAHIVQCGLDDNAVTRDSGIEYIGIVPSHWLVLQNRRLFHSMNRIFLGTPTVLSLSQKDGLIPYSEMSERSLHTSSYENWQLVHENDLVLNRFKAHLGVFFASKYEGIVTFHYGVYEPRRPLVAKYYEALYHTPAYCRVYAGQSRGMTVGLQNLSDTNFYSTYTVYPPYEEQVEIVSEISQIEKQHSQIIASIVSQIEMLQDLRTRLISDVVTGQIDVRGIEVPDYEHYDEAPENATEESSDSDYDTEE